MKNKGADSIYGIIRNGNMQKISEIDKKTGQVIKSDVPRLTSQCHEHVTDAHLLKDLLEYELRQEPHDDMFLAVAKFMTKTFDIRMRRTVRQAHFTPLKKEVGKHG